MQVDNSNDTTPSAVPDLAENERALHYALRYAELGIPVGSAWWPDAYARCMCWKRAHCDSTAKHPVYKNWQRRTTTDPDDVASNWECYPRANVFGACGRLFDVLDVDMSDLADWEHKTGIHLPVTWHQRTGSGNHQFMFRSVPGIGNRVKLATVPSTDTRGAGGLAILPPSRNARGAYAWINAPWDCELADWPADLLAAVRTPKRPVPSLAPRPEGFTRAVPAWLHRLADERAREGERNSRLFWLACRCRALGLDNSDALGLLWRYGRNCTPALDDPDVERTWQSSERHQGYEAVRHLPPSKRRPGGIVLAPPERRPGIVLEPPRRRPGVALEAVP